MFVRESRDSNPERADSVSKTVRCTVLQEAGVKSGTASTQSGGAVDEQWRLPAIPVPDGPPEKSTSSEVLFSAKFGFP